MENDILPEQGRANTTGLPPINLDWAHKDPNKDLPVYLIVNAPSDPKRFDPRGLHWSLSWEVDPGFWRQVNILEHRRPDQPAPNPRYVYWEALTKSAGPEMDDSKKIQVAVLSLAARQRIEQLALEVPVLYPNGRWNCQDWLIDLLSRMVKDKLITDEQMNQGLREARTAYAS
ncbi:hypothetical protein PYCCODRAFT_1435313 [Trametes coccinea BRFM310]|uniref:Uncharacterized protein n=1 Tax=Trametes coccinea (strain BRFM310) TaxID=1353009 RepID=A0A1Y2IR09_TRAC3|nr:hypothetical protein PYCCODRAFT_1435313 [Trametes coccinea BRFM310]